MNKLITAGLSLLSTLCLTVLNVDAQQAPVNLRSDSTFALLAGTTVTVTGGGTITGNIGIFPGTAYVPGNPAVTLNGSLYAGGPVAQQAQADLTAAYNDAAGRAVAPITIAGNIGGLTLAPGLYKSTSSLAISSGDLTLDAQGNANAVWIFQIASTLTTTSGRQVILAGGANPANIFWQVGTSATIGTTSVFQGNILASTSISMLTGSTLTGRALAMGGAVTVDTGGGTSAAVPVAPTRPTVTFTAPANGAANVPANSRVTATFSTSMNASTINTSSFTLVQGTATVPGSVTLAGSTATFTPASALAPLKTYTGTITSQAADQAGNTLATNFVWTFTTSAGPDTTPPTVTVTVPSSGAVAVSTSAKISATFSKPMDPSTITAATLTLSQGTTNVPGTVTYTGTTATFSQSSNLVAGATYVATVTTGAKDLSGNGLAANYTWSFVTGNNPDTTPPQVSSTSPTPGAQAVGVSTAITATFNKPMDPATITAANFTLQNGPTGVSGTVTWDGTKAIFTPLTSLAFSTTYTATIINGVRDLAGNPLAGNYFWHFTTAATVNPGPVLTDAAAFNGASYKSPLVAGSIAAVFGTNLSIGQAPSTSVPLPTTLAQAALTIGGIAAPLYFAMPTQVNVQVPWELAGQGQATMTDLVNGVTSNTQTVPLAPFAPGIFSMDATGSGQGAVLIAPTAVLAAASTPAQRNGYVSIFCTGLGAVNNPPPTGQPALTDPLSRTLTLPRVTIGGIDAVVSYSGLAPNLVGLYQVNAIVPSGVTPGSAVPVQISIGNASSNSVTIGVQ